MEPNILNVVLDNSEAIILQEVVVESVMAAVVMPQYKSQVKSKIFVNNPRPLRQ